MRAPHAAVAALVALAYAGCFVAIEIGLPFAPPLRFAGLRALVAGLALLAAARILGHALLPPPRLRPWVVALGAVLAVQYAAMFLSPQRVGPGIASVLANTGPIFLVLLGAPLLGERIGRRSAGALGLGVLGVGLIAWPADGAAAGGVVAVALPLTVAVGAAAETILVKRLRVGRALLNVAGWQLLFGAVPLMLVSVFTGEGPIRPTATFISALAFLAVPGTALGLALWYWLVQREPMSRLAGFMFMVPMAGLILAQLLLGDRASPRQGWGLALALCGILLATFPSGRVRRAVQAGRSGGRPGSRILIVHRTERRTDHAATDENGLAPQGPDRATRSRRLRRVDSDRGGGRDAPPGPVRPDWDLHRRRGDDGALASLLPPHIGWDARRDGRGGRHHLPTRLDPRLAVQRPGSTLRVGPATAPCATILPAHTWARRTS